jgi:hypothetical protein
MGLIRRCRSWALIVLAGAMLAMSWTSAALAQVAGGDGGDGDGDELSALAVVVGIAAVAVVGWLAYHRRSSRAH